MRTPIVFPTLVLASEEGEKVSEGISKGGEKSWKEKSPYAPKSTCEEDEFGVAAFFIF